MGQIIKCDRGYHPRSTTMDLVFWKKIKGLVHVLLIKRRGSPFKGCWAVPGGHLDWSEEIPEGADREGLEEVSLQVVKKIQLPIFSSKKRYEQRISVPFLVMEYMGDPVAKSDAAQLEWFLIDDALSMDLAFDHADILCMAEGVLYLLETKNYEKLASLFCYHLTD